jgi:hypothetical protein
VFHSQQLLAVEPENYPGQMARHPAELPLASFLVKLYVQRRLEMKRKLLTVVLAVSGITLATIQAVVADSMRCRSKVARRRPATQFVRSGHADRNRNVTATGQSHILFVSGAGDAGARVICTQTIAAHEHWTMHRCWQSVDSLGATR